MSDRPVATERLLVTDVRPYGEAPADLLINGGLIAGVFDPVLRPAVLADAAPDRVVDGHGLIVLPAFIDLHVHLREPGGSDQETIETGLAAAAAGGFSDVFAMANVSPVTDSVERVAWMSERARAASLVRTHPVGSITLGLAGTELTPIDDLVDAGVTLFSDDGRCVDDAGLVAQALTRAADRGVTIAQHSQLHDLAGSGQINAGFAAEATGLHAWPVSGEAAVIARDAVIAAETGGHLHVCHLSTRRSVEVVRQAKALGWPVSAEVTPHHLLLTDELAATAAPKFKVNPPLRSADDVQALREALRDGTIDTVGTDHAPHTTAAKSCGWSEAAFGLTGLETALSVVAHATAQHGVVDWRLITRAMHDAPARIGHVETAVDAQVRAGDPATLVFIDERPTGPIAGAEQRTKADNTPFEGVTLPWSIAATLIDGVAVHGAL